MNNLQSYLITLQKNLNILREREAKYAGNFWIQCGLLPTFSTGRMLVGHEPTSCSGTAYSTRASLSGLAMT
jgi:hypothetical protein